MIASQTICKLDSMQTVFKRTVANTTWFSDTELNCHFGDKIFIEDSVSCIYVSLNNGVTFTEACDSTLFTVKVPTIKMD